MSKTVKIIIIVAILAVIGVIAWYVYDNKEKKDDTNSNSGSGASTDTKANKKTALQKGLGIGADVLDAVSNNL